MSKVTMREVYRTLLDKKKFEWGEYRACAPAGANPALAFDEFMAILRSSELLVDKTSIKQKWEIAQSQGVLIPESKLRARINLSLIEIKADMHLPRVGERVRESVCESQGADARAGAHAREGAQE